MEMFSIFTFRILEDELGRGWYYQIYTGDTLTLIEESKELFDSEGTARYATIGHISLMESKLNSESARS